MKINAYKVKQDAISQVSDLETYLQLPKKDTLLWGLFYVRPKYLSFNSVEDIFKDGVFATPFDKHFKKNYPIQFLFRETIPDLWGDFCRPVIRVKDKIDEWLFPRQKWLLKKIPNHWVDKDYLIMELIFESIIHYVEEEKCFEVIEWNSDEEHKLVKEKIEKIYRWAKLRIKVQSRLEDYSNFYFYRLYESILYRYDKHFAKEAIDICGHLWT